jgi:hypothetical protein
MSTSQDLKKIQLNLRKESVALSKLKHDNCSVLPDITYKLFSVLDDLIDSIDMTLHCEITKLESQDD